MVPLAYGGLSRQDYEGQVFDVVGGGSAYLGGAACFHAIVPREKESRVRVMVIWRVALKGPKHATI